MRFRHPNFRWNTGCNLPTSSWFHHQTSQANPFLTETVLELFTELYPSNAA